jgi:hypothetical protein
LQGGLTKAFAIGREPALITVATIATRALDQNLLNREGNHLSASTAVDACDGGPDTA